ncbi:hypothetical protein Tco_1348312, partial [Tanacetum coccineum]
MVNRKVQLQALVDKKKVIITESTIRKIFNWKMLKVLIVYPMLLYFSSTLVGYEKFSQKLTFYKAFFSPQWKFLIHTILQCLSAKTTPWNKFSSTIASAIICLATNQKFNFSKYIFDSMVKNVDSMVTPSHTKKIFATMKREGKGFPGTITPLFPTMMVQAQEEIGECSEPIADEAANEENVPTHSNDPLLSGEDSLRRSLTAQAHEITSLKKRVKKLEKKGGSRTHKIIQDWIDMAKNPTATIITNIELTLAQTLAELKSTRPKTTIPSIDKGKGIMVKESLKIKKKDQVLIDEQEAIRLQAQFDEEERIARDKEEANAALIAQWNDIQKKIRRKHFAAKRAEERRNRPPTKAQQRSIMVNTFVDMDTELVRVSEVREEGSETREESSSKRAGDELEQEPSKKQVIPDKEEVAVDAIPLATNH